MQYIDISPNQAINLRAQNRATPTQAIVSALTFCDGFKIKECTLDYFGYEFDIDYREAKRIGDASYVISKIAEYHKAKI